MQHSARIVSAIALDGTVELAAGMKLPNLTPREVEVLGLVAKGHSNASICDALCVSPKTLETHLRHVYLKLDLPRGAGWHRRVLAARVWLLRDEH
jgi:DNA-binding CsgD family transcriptional regulator